MPAISRPLTLLLPLGAQGFSWVPRAAGVESSILLADRSDQQIRPRTAPTCPFNPDHVPAAPATSEFPYNSAIDGLPGKGIGGYAVPAEGDTLHQFQAPGPNDIRGPQVIPTWSEEVFTEHGTVVQASIPLPTTVSSPVMALPPNAYNVGFDLAQVLAVAGVGLDGDLVGTGRLSIGCDANSRTSMTGDLLANELGLNGHNTFEGDVSLTRNDYFTAVVPGDNYRLNETLFKMMMETCNGNCNIETLSLFRAQRYNQSVAENGEMTFGPLSIVLYGAASFLYELFSGEEDVGNGYEPNMMSFFGVAKDASGEYYFNNSERFPPNYRTRTTPYDTLLLSEQMIGMYNLNPVNFGGNFGPNNFNGMNYSSYITNGKLNDASAAAAMCQIFQQLTQGVFPTEAGEVIVLSETVETAIVKQLAPAMANFGCPNDYYTGSPVRA